MATYDKTKPADGDSPSIAPGQLRANFDVIKDIVEKDHQWDDTPVTNSGKHTKVRMPEQSAIPSGLTTNEGTLYTKESSSKTELYWSSENDGDEYQMTVSITGSFSRLGTNTNYTGNNNGGWTFLPGGLILQYGRLTTPGSSGAVTFPLIFPSGNAPFSIVITNERGSARASGYNNASSTGFSYFLETSGSTAINWIAIGN